MSRILSHVRSRMGAGLLLVLPLLITLWLLRILFGLVHENVTPAVMVLLNATGIPELYHAPARLVAPVVGLVLTALVVYLFGLLAGNLLGRRLWSGIEAAILRIPVVKGVYGAARQLLDALSATTKGGFSKVVLVEFPRSGLWTVGFVTNDKGHRIGPAPGGRSVVAVFVPTTPNPTSGWLVMAPSDEILVVDLSVEEGMKVVVSGGIVMPAAFGENVRPWRASVPEVPAP